MNLKQDKVTDLATAVKTYIKDGCHISIGGFTINRNPMAAVYEIIRQRVKNIHLYAHSNGQGVDELIGGGSISNLEIAYGGSGKFAATCIRFRKAVQENLVTVEDYTNYQMTLRFLAGSMGIPFLPTRSSLGTDIINKWGFSHKMRGDSPKLPDSKLVEMDNPFKGWCDVEKVVLVPAINPDVTIIHVQQADRRGNCRIQGLTFADVEQAKSAEHVIVTCEELCDNEVLKRDSHQNQIPFIHIDAVVHLPYGAYPTACYKYYDYDPRYLKDYAEKAKDDISYGKYLDSMIYGCPDHAELIKKIGQEQMSRISADPETGYAKNLDRR
ncbi:GctA [Desulfamplus magnetovallimortis]|uniref:GctA n=1 Tax=Desulfamplus magnetovallimortis TaxID=1246637 RepID=A0A1W1H739_9BACT|nr:CoA transferase [Desulfamplus magnetovallimortis]SLM28205.1 GctA [Desulfamplus magnetovallimortis]